MSEEEQKKVEEQDTEKIEEQTKEKESVNNTDNDKADNDNKSKTPEKSPEDSAADTISPEGDNKEEDSKKDNKKETSKKEKALPEEDNKAEEKKGKGGKIEASPEKVLDIIELVKTTGKLKKGINEVTKSIEKGKAKLVVVAKDINPPEVAMHLPLLSEEKSIPFAEVNSKEELGAAAGMEVSTTCVAVINEGEAKESIKDLME